MIFIKNISIKRRVLTGYAILITLMSVVFYISLDALSNATIGFKEYRTIARVTNISGRIQANMLKLRMNAKNFQIDGDQSFLLDYNETLKKLDALIAEGEITVLNNEEKAEIQNIKKKVKTYDTNFTKIVDFRLRRDDYVYHILDLEGPFMEKSLSNILATAEADGDQIASFHTAYVLKRLLLARLYVSKFLDTNDDNAIERVKMEFSNMERQLSILKKDLQNPKRKKLRTQVQTSMVKYTQTFAELVSVIKNRNDIQKNILDKIGPEVASSIERMKLSVKNNQDSLGPRLQESNQVAETFIILVGIISLFISLFFSYIIVKSLTKPLGIITQSALSLSKGNVNLEIQIDTKDEIGVLANSFKKIIQSQKQKTEVAKKIADGDYLVDVPISSEEDLLGKSMVNMRDALQQREQELNQYKREVSVRAEELAEAKTAAEAATEAKSSFLANMSHEIRTPMNAVIGFSHLIQKTELNEKQEDYVRKIESSSQSLLGIINDILDFSKIEAGKLTIESADFDLENVFQDLANIITYKAHEKKLEIVFGIDSKVPTYLNGDPLRLGQILTNLSNNAIKFTADGEIIICADLVSEDEGSVVVQFSVKDSGIGIKQDKISSLFESFTQADTSTSRKFGGTGLGLTISKNLAELMNGKIWAESEFGHGSVFKFTIKINKQKDAIKKLTPSTDLRGLKVLVVDDNEASRDILQNALESFTFSVTTVDSGQKAIDLLIQPAESPFELVLMDWNMPEMDGLATSEKILNNTAIPKIPVIMMVTAYGKEEVYKKFEALGLSSLLIKPVRYSYLFDTIMNSFGKSVKRVAVASKKMNEESAELDPIRGAEILLAEDNLINQQVATELLESAGFKITIANNGLEALEQLEQKTDFDIILMDLQMPEMGGYEATERIREKTEFKDLPIVAMTADAMEGVKDKCFKVGMNDFVTKPIDPSQLFTSLINWVKAGERDAILSKSKETANIEIPNIAGINQEEGLARVGGNKKLFLKLITDFGKNNEGLLQSVVEKLASKEVETAHRMIHTLKGTAGNLGMIKIHQLTAHLEKDLKEQGWDQFSKLNEALSVELTQLIDALKKALLVEGAQANNSKGIDVAIMEKLAQLLGNDDPEAINVFDTMGSIENPLFEDLKDKVNAYEFEEALAVLLELKKLI